MQIRLLSSKNVVGINAENSLWGSDDGFYTHLIQEIHMNNNFSNPTTEGPQILGLNHITQNSTQLRQKPPTYTCTEAKSCVSPDHDSEFQVSG